MRDLHARVSRVSRDVRLYSVSRDVHRCAQVCLHTCNPSSAYHQPAVQVTSHLKVKLRTYANYNARTQLQAVQPARNAKRTNALRAVDAEAEAETDTSAPVSAGVVTWQLCVAVAVICLGNFLFGWHAGALNPALQAVTQDVAIAPETVPFAVSSLVVGGTIGALLTPLAMDGYGRRAALTLTAVPMVLGSLLMAQATTPVGFILGRTLAGMGAGAASVCAPALVAELAPDHVRGRLSSVCRLAYVLGILATFVLAQSLQGGAVGAGAAEWWRPLYFVAIVPAARRATSLIAGAAPESPIWLARQGKDDAASRALGIARGLSRDETARWLQNERDASLRGCSTGSGDTWKDLFTLPEHARSHRICTRLAIFQALGGSNIIVFYAASLFASAGVSNPAAAVVIVGIANVAGTLAATVLTDSFGRKPLLVGSFSSMATCMCALALAATPQFIALVGAETASTLSCACVPLFILCFACGVGPIPYLLYSEVYASRVRAKGASFCGALNWGANILLCYTFLPMKEALGDTAVFGIYACINFAALIFVRANVFETRGRSLQEIENELAPTVCVRE